MARGSGAILSEVEVLMPTSIISLCQKGEDLNPVDKSQIHYPEADFAVLREQERTHFWFRSRRKAVLRVLSKYVKSPNPIGLDIGCGTGINASCFSESHFPTMGIDAFDSFKAEREKGKSLGFLRGDIFAIDPAAEFDFVLLLDVIEHIEKDASFVKQSMKFLKPGGIVLITVPAFPSLWSKIDEDSLHLRRYTKKMMTSLSQSINARIEMQFYYFGLTLPLYYLSRKGKTANSNNERKVPGWLNSSLEGILNLELESIRFGGFPFGSSLFAVMRKGEEK
jgi:SAM-dependent methyltransferase